MGFGVRSAECGVRNAECGARDGVIRAARLRLFHFANRQLRSEVDGSRRCDVRNVLLDRRAEFNDAPKSQGLTELAHPKRPSCPDRAHAFRILFSALRVPHSAFA